MKNVIDNQIVRKIVQAPNETLNMEGVISLRWPTLLEYLGLGNLMQKFPPFDQNQPLFEECLKILFTHNAKDVLHHLYDQLFAECLTQIKNLPEINPSWLINEINSKRQKTPLTDLLEPDVFQYENALINNPSHTMHDLILFLGWDRMCVRTAILFDHQSADPTFMHSLEVLKDCLIESYHHIAQHGRTFPSLYRLIEALYFYEMREENLQTHSESEWTILSQALPALKGPDELADFFYIDDAVVPNEENAVQYLTCDSPDKVNVRLALANYMLVKLNYPSWPKNIIAM